jgi:hypothetical protein
MQLDLEELRRLCVAATPGRWLYCAHATVLVEESPVKYRVVATTSEKETNAVEESGNYEALDKLEAQGCYDMEFIAAFNPQTALALLSHIFLLEKERDEARAALLAALEEGER